MITVALLSKWHVHAVDYAKEAMDNPNLSIKLVWDEDPERGREWAQELGVPFEADLDTVLGHSGIDGVIVTAPTNRHRDIMVKAARYGKHIYTEKVLAITLQECEEILAAIKANQVKFMISLPRMVLPYARLAQQMLADGALGRLTTVRCRCAHSGAVPYEGHPKGFLPAHFFDPEQCGGGALIDLGAHPLYLSNRLAGPARAVTARLTTYFGHPVDDNSAVIVEYESGALGILETSFVSSSSPFLLELHGTEGSLLVENEEVRYKRAADGDHGWIVPELPEALPSPMEQWVEAILNGTSTDITEVDAWRLTEINEAAALSHRDGKRVAIGHTPVQA